MKHYTKYLPIFMICGALYSAAVNTSTAQEVSRAEFEALQKQVSELQATINELRGSSVEAIAAELATATPQTKVEKQSLISNVVNTIQSREESVYFPWMDNDKWTQITKGMSPAAVVEVLGNPTLNEPSLHKRVDTVYTYEGRRVATAKKVKGIIRFRDEKVVEIERPKLD